MKRLRVGILLIIISWLPIAQVILIIAHNNQKLTTEHASSELRLWVWGIQILIGFIGVWLAGKVAIASTRQHGLKRAPAELWHLFRHGNEE
jgi:hypothetical protein